ncbi:MAG: MOSC and FAD-binding oxidoreductase domain-containing protein [Acetobacteraceae bacterium]
MAQLLSVNVGLPQDIQWHGKTVQSAIWKHAVAGRRRVRRLNLDGDKQGDLVGHGGEQRAVLVYQIESYHYWEREFGRSDFTYGQFGENLTVTGLPDSEVCIGDRYRIGSAVFEVSQPRVTCYRVGIRMGEPRMAALLVAHGRPGFYMRVLTEGEVGAGDEVVKIADGPEKLTVVEADALVYLPGGHKENLDRALRIDAFSPGWKTAFRAMAEQARGAGWQENKGIILNFGTRAAWPGFRPLRVAGVHQESSSVFSFDLIAEANDLPPLALAGQFITVRLRVGGSRAPVLRSYSLTDASNAGHYPVGVKCEPQGVAGQYVREHVRAGDMIDVAAPRGGFVLRGGQQPVVLLSAGIGVTPVLAMLRGLAAAETTRPVSWIHCARNGREHPFAGDAGRLLSALPGSRRLIAYSRPLPEDRPGTDFDLGGRLDPEKLHRFGIPGDADVYLCGPSSFMHDMAAALALVPVLPAHIRTENFGPRGSLMPGIVGQQRSGAHAPPGPAGTGPRVSFARSGVSANWDDRYASLLELAEACNVSVRWACRTGVCHTCISRLLSGAVRYDPEPLERPSEDDALICCSRPDGEITIDI